MSKKHNIYFKRGLTLLNLKNFPNSFNLIVSNWNLITSEYQKLNAHDETDEIKKIIKSTLFTKVPELTVDKERFKKVQKELKVNALVIGFFIKGTGGKLLELSARDEGNKTELLDDSSDV